MSVAQAMPLNLVPEGKECYVCQVSGSSSNATRLREMGFVGQARLMVYRSDRTGVIVGIKDSRLAISRGMAKDILVTFLGSGV
jgi:ferrous iron transport protein A